jgi:predicted DNA-binding transcriptional regulator YafY
MSVICGIIKIYRGGAGMKIDRLVAIIMVLMERDMIGATELAEMFEVSLRTIYRDIEAIGKAGIPITSSTGPGGGVGIIDSYKMEKSLFSASDITTLLMGLGHVQSSFPTEELVNTLAKVRGAISADEYRKLETKANQIKIDISPWHGKGTIPQTLATVRTALDKQQVIRFQYGTRLRVESSRDVEPCRLLLKDMNWYMQGFCRTRQDYRTFKLLRMSDVCLLDETYTLHELPIAQLDHFSFDNDVKETLKLRIDNELLDEMANNFGEDKIVPDGDNHYIVTAALPIEESTARLLISYCHHCVCLEPASMRTLIKTLLDETMAAYDKQGG